MIEEGFGERGTRNNISKGEKREKTREKGGKKTKQENKNELDE